MSDKSFAIYMPAHNVVGQIGATLSRIPEAVRTAAAEIFVVDNASDDGTDAVVREWQAKPGWDNLVLIRNEENLGYGGSQKLAYRRAIDKGYDMVVMLHGDGQYAPEHLEALMKPVADGEAALVFGSRISGNPLKGGMPVHRWLGNRVLTIFQNTVLQTSLSEFHSGYRVYDVKTLRKLPLESLTDAYHFDTQIILLLLHYGYKIGEVTVPTFYGEEVCYVNIWEYGWNVLQVTTRFTLHKSKIWKSSEWERILK